MNHNINCRFKNSLFGKDKKEHRITVSCRINVLIFFGTTVGVALSDTDGLSGTNGLSDTDGLSDTNSLSDTDGLSDTNGYRLIIYSAGYSYRWVNGLNLQHTPRNTFNNSNFNLGVKFGKF